MSHWGAFAADVDASARSRRCGRTRWTPPRRRCSATSSARCDTRCGSPRRWCAGVGWSAGPGPDVSRGTDEFVAVGWDEALDRLAAELHPRLRRAGPGGGVRRLLRLVQRRAVPPRPEPGAPLPQLPRRLRPLGEHLQHRHVRGGAAADLRPPGRPAALVHRVAADRRPHRAARVLRRHPGRRTSRWPPAASPGTAPSATSPRWCAAAARWCWRARTAADHPAGLPARWLPLRPGTDVALMLALCRVLVTEGLHDAALPRDALRGRRRGARLPRRQRRRRREVRRSGRRRICGVPADDDRRAGPRDGGPAHDGRR